MTTSEMGIRYSSASMPGPRDEDVEDLLGGVGGGGDGVGGEDGQRDDLEEPPVLLLGARQRAADEQALEQ